MASVRKITGKGSPVGASTSSEGQPLALKLWLEGNEYSLEQLQHEAKIMEELSAEEGELPCPRLYDLVGDPLITGMVMEWCPADLERWWRDTAGEPDAFGRLCSALAEVCRRVDETHNRFASSDRTAWHGDLKPSNILLASDGRWLVSDFGTARVFESGNEELPADQRVGGTDNFLPPEILFRASVEHAPAADVWSLCATLATMLRMKRTADDGEEIPADISRRYRMARTRAVFEVFGADPQRFRGRSLDREAFSEPSRLPEEDRRSIRDSVRGIFGPGLGVSAREERLSAELLGILDRGMAIVPADRFASAAELAAALDDLAKSYIALAAIPAEESAAEAPFLSAGAVMSANEELKARIRELEDELEGAVQAEPAPAGVITARMPWGLTLLLFALLGGQVLTFVVALAALILSWTG